METVICPHCDTVCVETERDGRPAVLCENLACVNSVDRLIERWHEGADARSLHAFLGMSWPQYRRWVQASARLVRSGRVRTSHG